MKIGISRIATSPARTVLTVTTVGAPGKTAQEAINALYMTAYQTKFMRFKPQGKKMAIGRLSALWPDAHRKPKSKWTGIWGLQVSDFVRQNDLLQKHPTIRVRIAKRAGGPVAEILHVGTYGKEGPTVVKLHKFIQDQGYRIAGPHEEEYLTKPGPKAKTIIRYAVKKAARK